MRTRIRRLWKVPTFAELFLAFRQAKTALYYERRGVGLVELAQFEADLASNLTRLQAKLRKQPWFDGLDIGRVWVVPKRLGPSSESSGGIIHVGTPQTRAPRHLDVQTRLSPSPEFATVEVLYLRRFGPLLDGVLSPNSVGYRLDLRDGQLDSVPALGLPVLAKAVSSISICRVGRRSYAPRERRRRDDHQRRPRQFL